MKPLRPCLCPRAARIVGLVLVATTALGVAVRAQTIFTWNSGDIVSNALLPTTYASTSTLNIATGSDHDFNTRAIDNSGTVNWSAGNLRSGNGGTFVNNASGIVNVTANGYSVNNPFGGTFVFTNNGTLNRSGAGATTFSTTFDNGGTVNVTGGQLTLSGGGTSSGAFNVSGAGSLLVMNNSYALNNGATLSGAIRFTGGTLTANGTINVSGTSFQGGNLQGTQTFNGGVLNWSGGNWNVGAVGVTTTFASGATVNLSDANDNVRDFNFRSITNNGIVNWTAGYIRGGNGSIFTNAAGATFNDLNASSYTINNPFGGAFTFVNNGTYVRNAAGTTFFDTTFNNNGTINLQLGDLQFRAGGALAAAGTINAAAGTHVYFTSSFSVANGASLTGAGTYILTNGTFTATGTMNVGTFNQTGGTLGGVNTINGTYNWSGGNWNSGAITDTTAIGAGAILNLSDASSSTRDFNFRSITNHGTVNWNSGYIRGGNGSVFTNAVGATFNDFNAPAYTINNPFGGGFTFVNDGTYNRNAPNTSYFDTTFNNNGTINLLQGDLQFRGGGTMSAAATINTANNTHVYFTNNYTIADGGSLIGPGTYYLTNGTLTAGGTLNVSTFNQTGGALAGINTINGTYNWSGGNWNTNATTNTTTISATGTLNLSDVNGSVRDFNFRGITNNGVVNWSSGYIRGGNGSIFTNAAGATFNDLNAPGYTMNNPFGGAFTFVNNGNYIRHATGTTYIDTTFNNNAVVDVQQGDLQFRSGGTMSSTGSITAAAGSNVYFTSSYDIANAAALGGAGTYWLTGGTLTASGTINLGNFRQTGGALAGTNVILGNFTWSGGNWNAGASGFTTTIGGGGVLNLTDASNNVRDFNLRNVTNQGTVNWSSGYIRGGNGSVFTNAAGGVFNDLNTPGYTINNPFGGAFTFVNDGTYNRNVGGTSYFDTTFNNNGVMNLANGDVQIRSGGTMSATSTVNGAAGSHLYFTNSYTLADGAKFIGAGTFQQTNGTLTIDGALTASAFTWSGGNWNAANNSGLVTTIAPTTTLILTDQHSNVRDFNGRGIVNQGVVNWYSGYIRGGNGSVFTNAAGATFNDFNAPGYTINNPFGGAFTFVNDGLYVRNAANTTYFDSPLNNNGTISLVAGDIQLRAGGTMSGSSVVNAASGTHLYFTNSYTLAPGAQFTGPGTFQQTSGTLTINGTLVAPTFIWSGGNWNAANNSGLVTTIGAGTILSLTDQHNNVRDFNGRTILNQGVVNWSSGYIRSGNAGAFINAGTFNDLNTPGYTVNNPFGGSFVFTNNGTYVRNVTGTTFFDSPFDNNGTVNLLLGDIQLRAGGTMSASSVFNGAAGTHLYFTNNYTLATGAQFTGAGTFQQTSGTLTINGTLTAPAFIWSGGNWNAANNSGLVTTIGATTTLNLTDQHSNVRDFNGRSIVNQGIVNWTSGYIRGGNGSVFTNAAGATFNDLNAPGYTINNPFGGSFAFVNNGTYVRNAANTTYFDSPLMNNAMISLLAGDIQLRAGGTMSATSVVNAVAGTHLYLTNDYTLLDGAQFLGAGVFQQTGGTLTADGAIRASAFTWSGGSWNAANGSGLVTTIAAGSTLNLTDQHSNVRDFNGRGIANDGTVNWSGGFIRSGNGGSFVNRGVFNDLNAPGYTVNNPFGGTFTFTNNGTYNKATSGTTTFSVRFINNNGAILANGGTLRFSNGFTQTAGTINVASGAVLQFDSGLSLPAGILSGNGSITGAVTSAAAIAPGDAGAANGIGTLTFNNALTLTNTSLLNFQIGGTSTYDKLVAPTISLNGQLQITFANGFQSTVTSADSFTIVTTGNASGLTGTFTGVTNGQIVWTADGIGGFHVNYNANSLVLSGFTPVPEPSTYALFGVGLASLLALRRRRR